MSQENDYILWYCRDIDKQCVKFQSILLTPIDTFRMTGRSIQVLWMSEDATSVQINFDKRTETESVPRCQLDGVLHN